MIKVKVKISAYQLFISIAIFIQGTATLFYLVPEAKQDAWITMLIYIIPAIVLQIIYTSLWSKYPDDTLITYLPKIWGKYIGYLLSIIYIIYFTYISARVVRDFAGLMLISSMPHMPGIIVSVILVLINCYAVFQGVENVCRIAQVFLPLMVITFLLAWIFLFVTPHAVKLYNIKPILENGMLPVIREGWPLLTFPFGETLLFAMLYPSVVEKSKVRKAAILAVLFEGIFLTIHTIIIISVLGVNFATNSIFPSLPTARIMHIGENFDRLDILIIFALVIGGFFKSAFYMYGAMLGTAQLIKLKDVKYLSIPFGIIVLIGSQLIAKNYVQHLKIGLDYTVKYIHVPLLLIIPMLSLLIYYIKNSSKHA